MIDYCRAVDTCDEDLLKSVYHQDSYDDHGSFKGNGHEFATIVVKVLRKQWEATQHTIGDTVFQWLDDDTVTAETYVQAQHLGSDEDGPVLAWFAGVYLDRFERRDGVWRIADRRVVRTWDKIEPVKTWCEPGTFTDRRRV